MAISYIGGFSGGASDGGDVTLNLSGHAQNDLVIVAYSIGDGDDVDYDMAMVTADYTEVADLFANDTRNINLGVYWKVMGASPDTTAQVDGQGGTNASVQAVAQIFRGVDTTTPMDVAPTTATGINSNIPDPPSISHNNPSGVWTVAVGAFAHTAGGAVTIAAPANYVDIVQFTQPETQEGTIGMAYYTAPASPENPGSFTPSIADNTAHSWAAVTIALRPAAAGPAGQPTIARFSLVPHMGGGGLSHGWGRR